MQPDHDERPAPPTSPDAPELHVALAAFGAVPYLAWCVGLTADADRLPDVSPYEWPGMAVVA